MTPAGAREPDPSPERLPRPRPPDEESSPGLTPVEALERDYRAAFLRYLPRRDEAALVSGYELGRSAVAGRLSILELARVHHDVFLEVLRETPADELVAVATAASEFFLEVLATHDMAQRVFLEER